MAKIKNKNFVVGQNTNITFIDQYNNEHIIVWDNNNNRYIFNDGGIEATDYVNATNAHTNNRDPLPIDNTYLVPTIWVNSDTLKYFILRDIDSGVADWQEMANAMEQDNDPRITINNGTPEAPHEAYHMWVMLDEEEPPE